MHLSRKSNPIRQSMFSLHLCEKFSDDLIDLPRILYLLLRPAEWVFGVARVQEDAAVTLWRGIQDLKQFADQKKSFNDLNGTNIRFHSNFIKNIFKIHFTKKSMFILIQLQTQLVQYLLVQNMQEDILQDHIGILFVI